MTLKMLRVQHCHERPSAELKCDRHNIEWDAASETLN